MDVFQKLQSAVKMALAARKTQESETVDRQLTKIDGRKYDESPQIDKHGRCLLTKLFGESSNKQFV